MGKKVDKVKVEAKKLRQAAKVDKTTNKRVKKEIQQSGEEDIDAILAEFAAKNLAKTAVTVTVCTQPSPRCNFSMTSLPNGDVLIFGGEFFDGEGNEVYNDLFRWNLEKNEWKQIESLNTPSPRCSHQAVLYKDKVYIFGGEYSTLDQFHHYRDLWELDIKTNTWNEMKVTGDSPSARSGHRMLVWRSYIVLFGGFYEAMREVKW
jgi:N-acetylneuraminic acid mutarotase